MEPEKFWLHGYLFSAAELKSLVKLKKEKKSCSLSAAYH